MAELVQKTTSKKSTGFSKSKRLSTRVDLTPMVDLGFLLITFFIFTTALAKPTTMRLAMPDDTSVPIPSHSAESKTLTLLLGKDDKLFYYPGIFKGEVKEIDFKELRNVIVRRKKEIFDKFGAPGLVILIKVANEAKFKNVVDSLDEMLINGVSTYMLLDAEAKELEAIK